jgi:tetratricopeptide (TPR) repeat protein
MTSPGAAGNYPGNPSLPVEVREKILITFRHALGLFSSGHVSDCLIGCDFILKMDPRFTPARRLQEKARNRDSDVDISDLQAIAAGEAPGGPAPVPPPSPPKPAPAAAPPPLPPAEKPDPARLVAEAAARLSQRDYDGAIAMASRVLALTPGDADALAIMEKAAGRKATKPLLDASRARAERALAEGRDAEARLELERIRALDPESPAITALEARLESAAAGHAPAPEAAAFSLDREETGARETETPTAETSIHPAAFTEIESPEAYGHDSFSLEPPSPDEEALVPPPPPTSELFLAPEGSSEPVNFPEAPVEDEESQASQREIARLLKQGDEVSAKGDRQQAIEVWSRVFLIDINNAEAVTRIEKARQEMAEEGRMVADLLKKGRETFEAGDREAAKQFFRQAQALDPDEATARVYLDRIEQEAAAAVSAAAAGAAPKAASPPPALEQGPSPAPPAGWKAGVRLNPRVLGLIGAFLLLTMVGVYFVFKGGHSLEPAAKAVSSGSRARDQAGKDEQGKGGGDASRKAAAAVEPVGEGAREAKSDADPARLRAAAEKALAEKRYIEALKNFNLAAPAFRDDPTFAQQQGLASEKVTALTPAVKFYNEGEYETAIPILWRIVQEDRENRDARSYLLRAYYNQGITQLQNGLYAKAMQTFQEALALDPNDSEAARHRKFAERYQKGDLDMLGRIYVRHLSHRP